MHRYEVQRLSLRQDELWSNGVIQLLSYGEGEEYKSLYCLGEVDPSGHWTPLRVQGKVSYAYSTEDQAERICRSLNVPVSQPSASVHAPAEPGNG